MPNTTESKDELSETDRNLKPVDELKSSEDDQQLVPSKLWFSFYVLTMSLGTLLLGWSLLGNSQTALIFIEKFEWTSEEAKRNNSLLSTMGIVGMGVGALIGGAIIPIGRRVTALIMLAVAAAGVSLTLVMTFPTLVIGRFMVGFASGVLNICHVKAIFEAVPCQWYSFFGASANIAIAFGATTVVIIGGVSLPADESEYAADEMWRLSYGFQYVIVILQALLLLFVFKYEPIDFLLKQDRDVEAMKFLTLLYCKAPESVFDQFILKRKRELQTNDQKQNKITFNQALFGAEYWRATWVSFGIGICNQFSAIGPVSIFSAILLKKIREQENSNFELEIKDSIVIIMLCQCVGALAGGIPPKYFGRKTIMWTNHLMMGITHGLSALMFYNKEFVAMYCMILFFEFLFNVGVGTINFVYLGEVCADQAMGLIMFGYFATCLIMSSSVSFLIDSSIGIEGTFLCYCVVNLLATAYVLVFAKETKDKTPEERHRLYLPRKQLSQVEITEQK